ncbi:MAG: hypothetical protein IH921_03345 [Gemmatimonadetes bacterium]|nr:hypothetical protein [Gemmatimonadota bacterium]
MITAQTATGRIVRTLGIAAALGAGVTVSLSAQTLGGGTKNAIETQIADLEATIQKAVEGGVEAVAIGTPIDLSGLVKISVPHTRVRYELEPIGKPDLWDALAPMLPEGAGVES